MHHGWGYVTGAVEGVVGEVQLELNLPMRRSLLLIFTHAEGRLWMLENTLRLTAEAEQPTERGLQLFLSFPFFLIPTLDGARLGERGVGVSQPGLPPTPSHSMQSKVQLILSLERWEREEMEFTQESETEILYIFFE